MSAVKKYVNRCAMWLGWGLFTFFCVGVAAVWRLLPVTHRLSEGDFWKLMLPMVAWGIVCLLVAAEKVYQIHEATR
jgi:uncharacterized membrane protein YwaF